jgi:hypothetical protein
VEALDKGNLAHGQRKAKIHRRAQRPTGPTRRAELAQFSGQKPLRHSAFGPTRASFGPPQGMQTTYRCR